MRLAALAVPLAVAVACASRQPRQTTGADDEDDPAARATHVAPALDGYRAAYVLSFRGARIGEARERFAADPEAEGGYRFERTERVVVRRAGEPVVSETRIVIDTDVTLYAQHVRIERSSGRVRTDAEAVRMLDGGWQITWGTALPRIVDGAAVPSTLVPLVVAGGGAWPGRAFDGRVLLEGSGLALAELTVDVSADRRVADARIKTPAGLVRARARLDDRGTVVEAGDRNGVASRRAMETELAAGFEPPEIVEAAAIRVEGTPPPTHAAALDLVIEGVRAPVPALAELGGQTIRLEGDAWRVRVRVERPPVDLAALRERTHFVATRIVDDMNAPVVAPEEALATGRGDCTAHAIVLAKLLADRGVEARLVTGFLVQDGALRRHRWVVARLGRHWVAVDPTLDQVPAGADRIALAVHGSTPEELVFVDDMAFSGWDGARARYGRP